MLPLEMPPAQHVLLASVFLGGCLTGGALLSVDGRGAEPAAAAQPKQAQPKLATQPIGPSHGPIPRSSAPLEGSHDDPADAEHLKPEPSPRAADDPTSGPEPANTTSAADVLVRLEHAYQEQLAARAEPARPTPPSALDSPDTEPRELAAVVVGEERGPDAEVSVHSNDEGTSVKRIEVELSQVETHHTEVNQGNVHEGDVHIGDVNQIAVNQVAMLAYPVYLVPPGSLPTMVKPPLTPATQRIPRTDPWAPIYYSPRHNPWGPTFGRRP